MTAALDADDELHGTPVAVADNTAVAAVLAQFTPVVRRAGLLRFATTGGESAVLHDQLITHCQGGDADAARVAFDHDLQCADPRWLSGAACPGWRQRGRPRYGR